MTDRRSFKADIIRSLITEVLKTLGEDILGQSVTIDTGPDAVGADSCPGNLSSPAQNLVAWLAESLTAALASKDLLIKCQVQLVRPLIFLGSVIFSWFFQSKDLLYGFL